MKKLRDQMKYYDNMADLNWAISIITLNIRKQNTKFTNSAQMDKSKTQLYTI